MYAFAAYIRLCRFVMLISCPAIILSCAPHESHSIFILNDILKIRVSPAPFLFFMLQLSHYLYQTEDPYILISQLFCSSFYVSVFLTQKLSHNIFCLSGFWFCNLLSSRCLRLFLSSRFPLFYVCFLNHV